MGEAGLEGYSYFFDREEGSLSRVEQWWEKAKCRGLNEYLDRFFFPDTDPVSARSFTKIGKRFCNGQLSIKDYDHHFAGLAETGDRGPCAALSACLEHAMEARLWDGVFGGTSGRERRKLATQRARQNLSGKSPSPPTSATSSSQTSVTISPRKASKGTSAGTPTTSTPARSASRDGARGQAGIPSPKSSPTRRAARSTLSSPAKATTSTTRSKVRSGKQVGSPGSSGAGKKPVATSGGPRPRPSASGAAARSSATSKSQSKTRASGSSGTATGSSKAPTSGKRSSK